MVKDVLNKEELALLEAALYVAGRPLDLRTLGSIIGTRSKDRVLKLPKLLWRDIKVTTPLLKY